MKKYFAIDVGSNTMMMSVAQKSDGKRELCTTNQAINNTNIKDFFQKKSQADWQRGQWHYTDFFRFASLAKNMEQSQTISQERLKVGLEILQEYRDIIENESKSGDEIFVCATATSAIREAKNKEYIIGEMEKIFKSPINIISGEKEGELTFLGSANHIDQPVAVIDIGGGSSEIVLANQKKCKKVMSFPIGAVRWKDRYPRNILADATMQKKIISEIIDYLQDAWQKETEILKTMNGCHLYAVAGVATTLCAAHYGCALSDFECLEGKSLSLNEVKNLRKEICALSPEKLIKNKEKFEVIDENRAEIMGISSLIFEALLRFLCERLDAKPHIFISVRGLRYGLLYLLQQKMADKHGLKITQKI